MIGRDSIFRLPTVLTQIQRLTWERDAQPIGLDDGAAAKNHVLLDLDPALPVDGLGEAVDQDVDGGK